MTSPIAGLTLEALSETTWLLRLGDSIDPAVNARLHALAAALREHFPGVECVPAYASLLLRFDHAAWAVHTTTLDHEQLRATMVDALQRASDHTTTAREVDLPVCYGGDAGEDIADVAAHAGLTIDEVIARHTAATYRVAMLGFAPGFPYLLGLDPALAMPRRSNPRTQVPAGSVAIGGLQTGIYPQALPGGWQLIGRTPIRLFDLAAPMPSLLQPGDEVRFFAIDEHAYRQLAAGTGTLP